MQTAQTLLGTFGMTDFLMPLVLEDLTDEQARWRTRDGEGPSVTWLVGHLLHYRYYLLGVLGREVESPYGEIFTQPATDGSGYPTVDALLTKWSDVATVFQDALLSRSEAEWDEPGEGSHDEKTLRDQLVFFAWHEGYHMGMIGANRKALGLLGPAEKVTAMRENS